jgi:hypothetical protein
VFVDHAARRRLERCGQRSRRAGDIVVVQPGEALRRVARNRRLEEKEQLIAASVSSRIVGRRIATSRSCCRFTDRRGMLSRGRKVRAV